MSDKPSNRLSVVDRELLAGFVEITKPEPEQILPIGDSAPPEPKVPTIKSKLPKITSLAQEVLIEIEKKKQQVDSRCANFTVSISEGVGSPLFQAMSRTFQERTTTITYDHYKRALKLRQKLADEDKEVLRQS